MTAVLSASREEHARFPPDSFRSAITQTYFIEEPEIATAKSAVHGFHPPEYTNSITSMHPSDSPSSDLALSAADHFSSRATTLSSLSLSVGDDQDDSELILPSYDSNQFLPKEPEALSEVSVDSSADLQRWKAQTPAADDSSIEDEPSRHVDYLSHEWRQEDIWASWRYVVARRSAYDNGLRLENASWRTWGKLKMNLGTVSPETLNWLKDCDVTWLYGPLKTCDRREPALNDSPPPSRFATPTLYPDRKPILKKRTASETILQRSLSQHTLLQHAGAILKAQEAETNRSRPSFQRCPSDLGQVPNQLAATFVSASLRGTTTETTSSGIGSPSERRHIHFNNEVVQCIAVEAKEEEEDDEGPAVRDDSSSEDGVVMMKQIHPDTRRSDQATLRGCFSADNKTIAPLPSTTLKYRGDTPEPPAGSIMDRWSYYFSSSTSSAKTARPSTSANFLLDEDDSDYTFDWGSSRSSHDPSNTSRPWFVNPEDDEELGHYFDSTSPGTRTPTEDEESLNGSILDRVIDTMNTAKDIAHVIWNVGWRR
ncbi:protein phosphatase regulator REG1 [Aspergillus homomorphus CBS 101889]|uniref:Nitrogen regulatory protein areA GATA-like domain-containing protein n=1 Tax=Aspergillus homomorphus (strain CBS 101889) TaxID=1450537 RepID=A0A395HIZ2_ASPHC|nr:hypothetical protein BO97DRAFT_277904 [Aspergillus homomorphus CBS 101889]RAL06868.1 hypothetical protein BO97DRAFT_277904 [Aspergillus homomorphus CBS 101889]